MLFLETRHQQTRSKMLASLQAMMREAQGAVTCFMGAEGENLHVIIAERRGSMENVCHFNKFITCTGGFTRGVSNLTNAACCSLPHTEYALH